MKDLRAMLLTALVAVLSTNAMQGSHVTAGEILYECLGGGQYVVTLNAYRDCFGIPMSTFQTIEVTDPCGGDYTFEPEFIESSEISQLCLDDLSNSECNGGTLPGYEQYIFRDTITLSDCDFITLSWQNCCRNAAILNLTNAGTQNFRIETTVNTLDFPCDNSPVFNNLPAPFVCDNAPVNYGFAASEVDGDSLVYTLIAALENPGSPIPYEPGYSFEEPIPGITLDSLTGLLSFTPTMIGNFVVTVMISQYAPNGDLIGTIMRDMQFIVIACSNQPPDPTTGVISNLNGNDQVGDYAMDQCNSNGFCFDFSITDPDMGDSLTLTSNVDVVLPGATFTWTGGNPATGTICWNTVPDPNSFYSFIVQAQDDACPVSAFNSYVYSLDICEEANVVIPNVFTPNGDGSNDSFNFIDIRGFEDFTMIIYNRWGQVKEEITTVRNNKLIWRPSSDVSEGTYYYIFEGKPKKSDEVITRVGHVTLLR